MSESGRTSKPGAPATVPAAGERETAVVRPGASWFAPAEERVAAEQPKARFQRQQEDRAEVAAQLHRRAAPERATVQRKESGAAPSATNVQREAAAGVRSGGGALPHLDAIQRSFGAHDVRGVTAHAGPEARAAASAIGAQAYATGDRVAFGEPAPSLHTAAHEAAHALHQRRGAKLARGVGGEHDAAEHHADRAADLVVAGRSAQPALDRMLAPSSGPSGLSAPSAQEKISSGGVQRKVLKKEAPQLMSAMGPKADAKPEYFETAEEVLDEICTFNGFVADLVKTFRKVVIKNIDHYVQHKNDFTVDYVAESIIPNVIVGELHTNPDGRNFFLKHLGDFKAAGINNVVLEYDGSTPAGEALILANKNLAKIVDKETTLQEASDLAQKHGELLEPLVEMIGSMWKSDVPIGGVIKAAFKAGMRVVFGDYTPLGTGFTDAASMRDRDASFVRALAGLWANGNQRAIVIVGALHIRGMQQGLKIQRVPSLALNKSGLDLDEEHQKMEEKEEKLKSNKKKFQPKYAKAPENLVEEKPNEQK